MLWWYAVDEDGESIYRTGVLQRMKGWGKDPLLAVLCLIELAGPSQFSHFDGDQPVGVAHPARISMRLYTGIGKIVAHLNGRVL